MRYGTTLRCVYLTNRSSADVALNYKKKQKKKKKEASEQKLERWMLRRENIPQVQKNPPFSVSQEAVACMIQTHTHITTYYLVRVMHESSKLHNTHISFKQYCCSHLLLHPAKSLSREPGVRNRCNVALLQEWRLQQAINDRMVMMG